MNESEMRRRELLRQTRKLYNDSSNVPAVHPRYGRIYNDLYKDKISDNKEYTGSFYTRLVIGILCFICFVYIDQNKTNIAEVNSTSITEEIQKDFDEDIIKNVWNAL